VFRWCFGYRLMLSPHNVNLISCTTLRLTKTSPTFSIVNWRKFITLKKRLQTKIATYSCICCFAMPAACPRFIMISRFYGKHGWAVTFTMPVSRTSLWRHTITRVVAWHVRKCTIDYRSMINCRVIKYRLIVTKPFTAVINGKSVSVPVFA